MPPRRLIMWCALMLLIGAGPATKPAATNVITLLQGLPKDYRPDSTGNFNANTIKSARDWYFDNCLDSIVAVPITVHRIIGPTHDKEILIIPEFIGQRINGAPGLIQIREDALRFTLTDEQAKEASQFKPGKKIVIIGRIQTLRLGPAQDYEEIPYLPQATDQSEYNAIYRLDLRECSYNAK